MALKLLIVFEFIALIACLSSGFVFLMKDIGVPESKRTLYALGTRISIAVILMFTIAYGIQTGQLQNNAPWDQAQPAPLQNN